MSNIWYEDKMYNTEIKEAFLNDQTESTRDSFERIFKASRMIEIGYHKDLFDFNRDEIRDFLYSLIPKSINSSQFNVRNVYSYLEWAIEEGKLEGISPLEGISIKDWSKQFVNNNVKKYWTKKEIIKICDHDCANAQTAVIIMLLFEGVRGKANSEITNLMKDDVKMHDNRLFLIDDDGNKRNIEVSEKCISLCLSALEEKQIMKNNGNASEDLRSPETIDLVFNKFVVKSARTRTTHYNEAEKNIVNRKLDIIKREIGQPYFIPMNIVASGMIAKAYDLFISNGDIGEKEYQLIFDQFGEHADSVKTRIKSDFLNLETIKKVYENEDELS